MNTEWLLAWWNLIYELPVLLALLYLAVYVTSGMTFGGGDAHPEADLAEADIDGELDAEAGADAGEHLESGAPGDGHELVPAGGAHPEGAHPEGAHPDLPLFVRVLSVVGVGQVPLSLVLMVLFFTWGILGFIINNVLRPVFPAPWMVILASWPLAAAGSVILTRGIVKLVARWLPTHQTYAQSKSKLVGCLGEAVFPIDRASGTALVRDRNGDLFQIHCRTYGEARPIEKGREVLLVDYDQRESFFYVKQSKIKTEADAQA